MTYSIDTHCPDCFKASPQAICACGFDRDNYLMQFHSNRALPLFTQLEGGYILGRFIDSGSFGMVYTAIHQDDPETQLAIKEYYPIEIAERVGKTLIAKEPKTYLECLERFEQESDLFLKCQRYPFVPGVVRASGIVHQHSSAYLVMERLYGYTLQEFIVKQGLLTSDKIASWLKPLLQNLHALHKRDIYHRDLKPTNIFLRDAPNCLTEPVLMDFGIAREGELKAFVGSRMIGTGSMHYRAPEMIDEDYGYTIAAHTDIYSIGAVLCFCLYGKPPEDLEFPANNKGLSLKNIDTKLIKDTQLHEVILECLHRNPNGRPQNAQALLKRLDFLWQRYDVKVEPINIRLEKAIAKVTELETVLANLQSNKQDLKQKINEMDNYWHSKVLKTATKLTKAIQDKRDLKQRLAEATDEIKVVKRQATDEELLQIKVLQKKLTEAERQLEKSKQKKANRLFEKEEARQQSKERGLFFGGILGAIIFLGTVSGLSIFGFDKVLAQSYQYGKLYLLTGYVLTMLWAMYDGWLKNDWLALSDVLPFSLIVVRHLVISAIILGNLDFLVVYWSDIVEHIATASPIYLLCMTIGLIVFWILGRFLGEKMYD